MKYLVGLLMFFLAIATLLIGISYLFHSTSSEGNQVHKIAPTPSIFLSPTSTTSTTTLFVPYWTMSGKSLSTTYDQVAYFGITANTNGIDTAEDGYIRLPQFVRMLNQNTKMLLVVRLITPEVNEKVLTDNALQQKVISESISIAHQYGFSGIVLDFEYNALAFDSVVTNISHLSENFGSQIHKADLLYYQTLYGDTFYRLRPFNVAEVGKAADGIFVMAYDFHKANGNAGPNFPLHALSDEDYSFAQMVQDFTQKIPPQKLTILFGLFGYDWTINNKNQSLGQAAVMTTVEAQDKFLPSCSLKDCKVARDAQAVEQHAAYTDKDGRTHQVWFEDMDSVSKKQEYLKTKAIFSTGFWAWSYF